MSEGPLPPASVMRSDSSTNLGVKGTDNLSRVLAAAHLLHISVGRLGKGRIFDHLYAMDKQ